ncbi:MAG TPA: hypothetical protein VMV40_05145 [Acidiferrobacter sp.]|nr:hypothetical protein [Acidiferrobacter sp.]
MKPWIIVAVALLACTLGALPCADANLQTLRRDAQKGVPRAQFELGELYQYGTGQPNHLVRALSWYERAAPKIPRAAVLARRIAAQLTPEQRQQAAAWAKPQLGPR